MLKKIKMLIFLLVICVMLMPSASMAVTTLTSGWNTSNMDSFNLPGGTITSIIGNILSWILAMFGIIGIIGFIISGMMYILAAGDDGMIEKAKAAMKYSIIGVIVGLVGFVAIQAIDAILNASTSI